MSDVIGFKQPRTVCADVQIRVDDGGFCAFFNKQQVSDLYTANQGLIYFFG